MNNNKYKTISISKEKFDIIKEYCDKNAYNMGKWVSQITIDKINQPIEIKKYNETN
jgi:hypothetical protein